MTTCTIEHKPVLLSETMGLLSIESDDVVFDGTLGLGGHSEAILAKLGKEGFLIATDLDSDNLEFAKSRLSKHDFSAKFELVNASYTDCQDLIKQFAVGSLNKALLDLGLSSPHLDDETRGFAFKKDGPLDMRFDRTTGVSAADFLRSVNLEELIMVFRKFGEVDSAPKYAKVIVSAIKSGQKIDTTFELVNTLDLHLPMKHKNKILAQIFQALRIVVNDELATVELGVSRLWQSLGVDGKIVIISYHSLEDRIVKSFFADKLRSCVCPMELLVCQCAGTPEALALVKKVLVPTEEEAEANPRSRSAKLRAYQKLR
jgi:16S rRNA (cytosine1402-N4)-methyltransferase